MLDKLKEVSLSTLPIVLAAAVLAVIFKVAASSIAAFLLSSVFVIIGLTLFLTGVDVGLIPIGNKIGQTIVEKRNIVLIIIVALLLGFIITIAEPDVRVLASQVCNFSDGLTVNTLVYAIAIGVAVCLMISLVRTIMNLSLRWILTISYLALIIMSFLTDEFFVSVGFDSGGATTGPMSVPFIMALGMGVASLRKHDEEANFGYVAIASVGSVVAVIILGMLMKSSGSGAAVEEASEAVGFGTMLLHTAKNTFQSILPLLIVCILMQVFVMKMPPLHATKIFIGIFYAYIGLVLFSFGVEFSFSSIATELGMAMASASPVFLIITGALFGFVVVLAEPAIWVLTETVEDASNGKIPRKVLLYTLAIGVSLAVVMGLLKALFSIPIIYFIAIGYGLIIILMWITPKLFAAIAFDSGGVATGPMSSSFLLPFALGSAAASGNTSSFGLISLIAMMPIISIELLGLIFKLRTKEAAKES